MGAHESYRTHTVQPGDSVATVAARYNVPVEQIVVDNHLASPVILLPGQLLLVVKQC